MGKRESYPSAGDAVSVFKAQPPRQEKIVKIFGLINHLLYANFMKSLENIWLLKIFNFSIKTILGEIAE